LKKIVILGSTGSIGKQTLEVLDGLKDELQVSALTANTNYKMLAEQVRRYNPQLVALSDHKSASAIIQLIKNTECRVESGSQSQVMAATWPEADIVVLALVGFSGFEPLVAALKAGKTVALANKESLVVGGEILKREGLLDKNLILPVDSEHSAVMQSWTALSKKEIARIYLTASGGPFFGMGKKELENISPEQALKHPNWKMGAKITVDSATMMNKGLEVMEARWLFGLELEQIEVVIHRQSIVHSMVEYIDGSIIAQLGIPDMRIPIQFALTYPERKKSPVEPYTPFGTTLSFEKPDLENFPCLALARQAAVKGGTMPAVLNAANEIAVNLFLEKKLSFTGIPKIIEKVMNKHDNHHLLKLDDIIEADRWARMMALEIGAQFLRKD
jgi:1-deoxy-D-xylulose-5-phosphate reductoisomerase